MTKLLITGGCSFSDSNFPVYIKNNVEVWPHIVEKNSDRLLFNVASYGASNDLIENKIFDAVTKYKDYDCVVMVLWTDIFRVNLADEWRHNSLFAHRDYNIKDKDISFFKAMFEKFFRNMRKTKLICQHYNFPCHFRIGANGNNVFIKSFIPQMEEWLKKHTIQEEMNISWMELLYGCTSSFSQDCYLDDGHPNQIGHQRIANMFINEICELVVRHNKGKFVYD